MLIILFLYITGRVKRAPSSEDYFKAAETGNKIFGPVGALAGVIICFVLCDDKEPPPREYIKIIYAIKYREIN